MAHTELDLRERRAIEDMLKKTNEAKNLYRATSSINVECSASSTTFMTFNLPLPNVFRTNSSDK